MIWQKWVGLAKATHPLPTLVVVTISVLLAIAVGRNWQGCLLIALTVLSGQLSVGWSNDAIDYPSDSNVSRVTKPIVAGLVSRVQVWHAAVIAAIICVPLSLANGFLAGVLHLSAVASAWLYNLYLKSTVLSWLPYAFSFAALPAFVMLSVPTATGRNTTIEWWAVLAGGLLGISAHFANVLPDMALDKENDVRGLPQVLGAKASKLCAAGFFGAAVMVILAEWLSQPS